MCKNKMLATSKTPARIREQRKRKGWTQDKLAEEISLVENNGKILDGRTVLDWENRKTIPPLGRVQVMAKLFDCDVAYLLGDGEDGVRRRTTADVSAVTGLSVQAVERLSQIREKGLSGQLSSLLEWDGLAGLLFVRLFLRLNRHGLMPQLTRGRFQTLIPSLKPSILMNEITEIF